MMPALNVAIIAEDRSNAELQLLKIAAALAAYRAEKASYPDQLAGLSPRFISELPEDLFGSPLRYCREGSGYLLWSLGKNELDDGGSNGSRGILNGHAVVLLDDPEAARAKIPESADDISLRGPAPRLRLPAEPAPVAAP